MIDIGVTVVAGDISKDMRLSYDETDTGRSLVDAMSTRLGTPVDVFRVRRTGQLIGADLALADLDLLHGDLIDASSFERPRAAWRLRRTGRLGPDVIEIPPSGLRVGRLDVATDLVLDDPTVSKLHAVIAVRAGSAVLDDAGSTNGTKVGGVRIDGPRVLAIGDTIEFGEHSSFVLESTSAAPDRSPSPRPRWTVPGKHLQRSAGRFYISRSWREMRPRPTASVAIDAAPEPISRRRFPLPLIVLPVVVGVVIVVLTGNPMFLAFGALGPLMAGWNWWDDRQSGVKQHRANAARYLEQVDTAGRTADQIRIGLRAWREWADPPTAVLVDRALSLDASLWDRHRSHPDFLEVRVGTGDVPADARVQISERGAADLVAKAVELRSAHAIDDEMAVSIRLQDVPVLSLVGAPDRTLAVARSLAIQLAVRNSPDELTLAFVGDDWSWADWLPHAAADGDRPLVGRDADGAARVLREVESRIASPSEHLVLFVQPPVAVPAARLNAVLAAARTADVSIVWLADASGPPAESVGVAHVAAGGALQLAGEPAIRLTSVEWADEPTAAAVARSLAPLVDPGTSSDGVIPERVGLLDVIGTGATRADSVLAEWRQPHDDRLLAPIGVGKDGVVTLDLSAEGDGPNGLVGGTVGAGKSEFLQSLVLSLAATYGPDQLNFLFVDFKGGATFHSLLGLPHVVGMIRNLDGDLAVRAQRSLQAEFVRRQKLLPAHGVQKMSELRAKDPDRALPSLVVVIDEYAELAQKLPEFIEAVVELAQTGRALGLHLLLATQAPGQSVNRTIQNCVKYRISFRLKDSNESTEILGRGRDASTLPNRPGRGLFLDGDNVLHEFQGAWAGGRTSPGDELGASAVTMYGSRAARELGGPTDLERVRDAIVEAGRSGGYPPPRRPWHEPLPRVISIDSLDSIDSGDRVPGASADGSLRVRSAPGDSADSRHMLDGRSRLSARPPGPDRLALGVLDLPAEQLQPTYEWDLVDSPNLIVYGDARTGKTSLLRTIAARAATTTPSESIEIVGFDAAGGGLGAIDVLPNVRAVVASHDPAGLRRAIAHLRREEQSRRAAIGRAGSLHAHRRSGGEPIADLVVLVDGFAQLLNTLETIDGSTLFNAFTQLITDGSPAGIHFVLATDQPQRVPMSVKNTARERLVLRLASRDAASAAEVHRSLANLPDGRAYSTSRHGDVQLAVLGEGPDFDASSQARALDALAARLASRGVLRTARLAQPLAEVSPSDVPRPASPRSTVAGLDDLFLEPVVIDFATSPTLAVAGPDVTGRTNVVTWIARSLRSSGQTVTIYMGGRGDVPAATEDWTHVLTDAEELVDTLEAFAATVQERAVLDTPLLVAIDDADELIANPVGLSSEETQIRKRLATAMDTLLRSGRGAGIVVVVAGRLNGMGSAVPWAQRIRQNGQAVLLAPATLDVVVTDPVFNATLPRRSGYRPAPGTGVVLRRGEPPVLAHLVHARTAD